MVWVVALVIALVAIALMAIIALGDIADRPAPVAKQTIVALAIMLAVTTATLTMVIILTPDEATAPNLTVQE